MVYTTNKMLSLLHQLVILDFEPSKIRKYQEILKIGWRKPSAQSS